MASEIVWNVGRDTVGLQNHPKTGPVQASELQQMPRPLPPPGPTGLQRQRDQMFGTDDTHRCPFIIVRASLDDGFLDQLLPRLLEHGEYVL